MWDPTKKRYPISKAKGETPARWYDGQNITFRIRPHTHQRCLEGSKKTKPDLLLSVSCGGMGQQWPSEGIGALAAADPGGVACGISPLGGGRHYPTIEPRSR